MRFFGFLSFFCASLPAVATQSFSPRTIEIYYGQSANLPITVNCRTSGSLKTYASFDQAVAREVISKVLTSKRKSSPLHCERLEPLSLDDQGQLIATPGYQPTALPIVQGGNTVVSQVWVTYHQVDCSFEVEAPAPGWTLPTDETGHSLLRPVMSSIDDRDTRLLEFVLSGMINATPDSGLNLWTWNANIGMN